MQATLQQIAEWISISLPERIDPEQVMTGLAPLESAQATDIAFYIAPTRQVLLEQTQAGAVICDAAAAAVCPSIALVVDNPRIAFSQLAMQFEQLPVAAPGVHPSAVVAEGVVLGENISIGLNVVIEAGVSIGDNTIISAGCVIGQNAQVNANCRLWPNVTVAHGVIIGQRCILHSGAVIGSDGFGLAKDEKTGAWLKTPQLGIVRLGDDVEVGANTTIDRGALDDTVISEGVKLDNQIQIGHNVRIGAHTAIAGCVAVGGSTKIGRHCMIGGLTAITGHIEICDGVMITGSTGVSKSITESGVYSSAMTATPRQKWLRLLSHFKRLDELLSRVKKLEQQL